MTVFAECARASAHVRFSQVSYIQHQKKCTSPS